MSEFTQHEIGLMTLSSYLLEQQLRTELAIKPIYPATTHEALISIDGVNYKVEFKATVLSIDGAS